MVAGLNYDLSTNYFWCIILGLARKEIEELVQDFLKVWNIIRLKLPSFG